MLWGIDGNLQVLMSAHVGWGWGWAWRRKARLRRWQNGTSIPLLAGTSDAVQRFITSAIKTRYMTG